MAQARKKTTRKKPASKRKRTRAKKKNPNYLKLFIAKVSSFLKGNLFRQILGYFFWLLAIIIGLSLFSYITTGAADQSVIKDRSLWESKLETQNSAGKLGSYLSDFLFYKGFGFSSLIIVVLLFLVGNRIVFGKRKYSMLAVLQFGLSFMVLSSLALSFIFYNNETGFPWGGNLGYQMVSKLRSLIGVIPTSVLIIMLFATFFLVLSNHDKEEGEHKDLFNVRPLWQKLGLIFSGIKMPVFKKGTTKTATASTATADSDIANSTSSEKNTNYPAIETNIRQPKTNEGTSSETNKLAYGNQIELDFEQRLKEKRRKRQEEQKEIILDIVRLDDEDTQSTSNEREDLKDGITSVSQADKERAIRAKGDYDPTAELSGYKRPHINLLKPYGRDLYDKEEMMVDEVELKEKSQQIIDTLRNYNIEIKNIKATPGPTVTLYEIVPEDGVRISKIRNLEDDIALSLAALGIRIIAPMPGRGTIGIEVPNENKEIVSLRGVFDTQAFKNTKFALPIALGRTIADEPYIADLGKMPHLLLAGATGQGKSVCLNTILTSLLYKKHPAELKFVLIDPKKVELSLFNRIEKHFLAKLPNAEEAIVTDIKKVIHTLLALCIEMDDRYDLLKAAQVRNIREYNQKFKKRGLNPLKGHRFLPYFVLVVDEFADLIMTAGKEIEMPLARLAQLARAVGIHLVIATQRPTVNIITGTIKANFPARVAFRVTSKIDSRTILDAGGANQLIGRGDMLLSYGGETIRLQGAFIDTPEVEMVVDYIAEQKGYEEAFMLPEYRDDDDLSLPGSDMEFDDLFEDAAKIVVQSQSGSTSLLQRRLKLGYNRAGRIMDQLEAVSIVGPSQGSKARDVYVLDEFELTKILETLKG